MVQLSTSRHKPGYQRLSRGLSFRAPTADTGQLTAAIIAAIKPAFNSRAYYHRVNILLQDLVSQLPCSPTCLATKSGPSYPSSFQSHLPAAKANPSG